MHSARPAELVIGSVQLGLTYGAANRAGKPSYDAALGLVRRAADAGITQFDTARAYGDAEDRVGAALAGRSAPRAITKLSPLTELAPDAPADAVRAAVDASIAQSCAALRRDRLDCLLLHRAAHLTAFGGAVWTRLTEHLEQGTVLALGVSVQSPAELLSALSVPDVAHVQLAFNILDWRWHESGAVAVLRARPGVSVHVRSVFLQGLLVANDPAIWPHIPGVDPAAILDWLATSARTLGRENVADLCLSFVRSQDWIDGVVIGMETMDQLETNLHLYACPALDADVAAALMTMRPRVPASVLDPAQWPRT